jgi:glucose/arabinose dehydrogenase
MKKSLSFTAGAAAAAMFAFSACSSQEDMASKPAAKPAPAPAPAAKAPAEKAPEKAKATKLAGDVGLLDTEKNYMIIVTKDGKLVTIDFDAKAQAIARTPHPAKVADIGLGSSATVQYTKQGDKNVATSIEYLPAKGE